MSSSANIYVDNGSYDKLLSYLMGLDQSQLEEFKLCLQSPQLLLENFQKIPWANLKAIDPINLLCLLSEYFSEKQMWEVTLSIFENMNLTSLCMEIRATMNVHRRRYRERMKAKILMMWDNMPWPEDHIYLRNVTEKEHEELKSLLYPNRTGAQPQTIILEGIAGVGKTTLAMKAMLHWAEGFLFQQRFSYVFFISCHKVKDMKDTTFAGLLSWDWPDSQVPIEELMSHPERLLFVIDGFEEMDMPSNLDNSPPCTDWYQQLPVNRILFYLLKKELVPMATLLITTKEYRTKDLKKLLLNPWFVQILGFTEGDREEYFIRYFGDQKKAKKVLYWVRKNETLFYFCSAPLVCWTVCSCLKRQMVRNPHFQISTQTTTSLYVHFFSSLFATAEVSLSEQNWPEQWSALCSLAAEGMWFRNFTFTKEDLKHKCLEAHLIGSLLRLNILRKVNDCEECVTFTHQSFQVFLGAMFYVLRGTKGSIGGPAKHEEMRVLLNDALVDRNFYWNQMALFFFGLLKRSLIRELEDTLCCKVGQRIMDELLEWAEELKSYDIVLNRFEFLHFFSCLYETQEENFVRQILSPLLEADINIFGNQQLQVSSFCLKHCRSLSKLRLSVTSSIPQTELTFSVETLEPHSKIYQWQDICSVFCNGHVSELDLSNSKLNTSSMKKLCYELRNPRCKLRKLTCKSITPVKILKELVLVLHGNNRLTHLNLSSNNLGVPVSTMIFKTLRHSACNLQYLCLEKCNLSAAIYQDLALHLSSTQRTTRLCLGFNPLQDDGVRLLCAALTHPECALERLVLWFCQLGAPSCRYLSDALLKNKSLTHLNLRRNKLRDEGVKFLCKALSHPDCSLQNLDLSDCSFTADGCQELANALRHNHNMKILDIRNNDVQDNGVKHLCEVLQDPNCELNTLGLEKCNLTPACCQHLSSVLTSSKSLVNLNLLENDLEPSGVSILWKALKKSMCKLQKLG
ncbi:NACHT, LRR and PYD domains-containing protein 13-like [Vulpes lagopus]|uniref:NACHT, LRR and PYD domains-containing protein 13-like n=1 Tax=Vulpes lagopus TaxID=494514 RepID=UPI001BC90DEB|nr:NACHT, LRR and PYD domains-containing protein 13-like [Vulpes lagopus]